VQAPTAPQARPGGADPAIPSISAIRTTATAHRTAALPRAGVCMRAGARARAVVVALLAGGLPIKALHRPLRRCASYPARTSTSSGRRAPLLGTSTSTTSTTSTASLDHLPRP
jgi:hypothetical protein